MRSGSLSTGVRLTLVTLLGMATARAAEPPSAFQTPLTRAILDPAAFVVWAEGRQSTDGLSARGPSEVLWTIDSRPEWSGQQFADSRQPGVRHLRIGFKQGVQAGSILARANGTVSVLKPTATYPGRPEVEEDWIPAERMTTTKAVSTAVGREEYALWVLPQVLTVRAMRITHDAQAADTSYAGWLGGAYLLPTRMANLAPLAVASASSNDQNAKRLNNGQTDGWSMWENAAEMRPEPVSQQQAEWVLLAWPAPVELRGLCTLFTGFASAEAQTYTGPADRNPRDATDADWTTLSTWQNLPCGYPLPVYPNWLDFGKSVTTRAIRLRITQPLSPDGAHEHIAKRPRGGKCVWLSEIMALHPLAGESLQAVLDARPAAPDLQPPIPVRFTLPEAGYATLAIEDTQGVRVRNLIAETPFPAGENVVYWDGSDDLGRDPEAAHHGIYQIPIRLVQPGTYQVRGLYRKKLDLRYEMSVYDGQGNPPWETADKTGGWLTNHTPPSAALYVPGDKAPGGKPLVYLGSYVSEGGAGLAWVDLEGRKQGGRGWIGGNWTAAPYLARDTGAQADPEVYAYVASAFRSDTDEKKGEIRLTALTAKGDRPIVKHGFDPSAGAEPEWSREIGGLAARDGLLVVSLPATGRLLFVDGKSSKVVDTATMEQPRGLAFDAQGRLLVLTGQALRRYTLQGSPPRALGAVETLIGKGLEDPQGITIDAQGRVYISDRGASHQVKVFDAKGAVVATIGKPGVPQVGPYDPERMNNPRGLSLDGNGRLWVAEEDYQPKRVSVWNPDGTLWRAFYGPSEYGGGGTLDPKDKTRFYYYGMEFALDWQRGAYHLVRVFYRPTAADMKVPDGYGAGGYPQTPLYAGGRQYMTDCYNSNPTNGASIATLWLMRDGRAVPVAAVGRAHDWKILKTEPFRASWPRDVNPAGNPHENGALSAWSDLNADGQMQPNEVKMSKARTGGVTVMPDLSFVVARVDDQAMVYRPRRTGAEGVPEYDLSAGEVLASGVQTPTSSGGDQALVGTDRWTILTVAPQPFAPQGVGGAKAGRVLWSYPSLWPGLHASHEAPPPDRPGELIGTTRLLGGTVIPSGSDVGPLWAINGNHGNMYLLTQDGLFVAQLFQDMRLGKSWSMPVARRGMLLNDLTLHDENFWPSLTQTTDGQIYLVDGGRSSIVRVEGLETLRRLPTASLRVTEADLDKASQYFVQAERLRQQQQGQGILRVALRTAAPAVDGKLDDWVNASWVDIDKRGVAAYFNSDSKPYNVSGAMAVAKDRLYVAYRAAGADLLRNSGEIPNAPFKTGGALDVMIAVDASAQPGRERPVAGDQRLLVTRVNGQTKALLYRAVVPGTTSPAPFSSPWRTIALDRVDDVSAQVEFAQNEGDYEISVPLSVLGLQPKAGLRLRGDVGILRGNGFQTTQRVYWSNKATAIVADVPSEAMLMPGLWGTLLLQAEP